MTGGFITSAEKLAAVRRELRKQGLDGMLLTRADRFQGEEVRGQDEYLAWLTGFTGSAGVALILADRADGQSGLCVQVWLPARCPALTKRS